MAGRAPAEMLGPVESATFEGRVGRLVVPVIVTLIIICEIGFWVLLAGGLCLRYLARMPRLGVAVLLCEPLLEIVLLVVTALDLRRGAEPDWKHGLAAVYIGFSVAYGHYLIRWADGHFTHRFLGGPPPVKPPRHGWPRAVHEWKMAGRSVLGAGIAAGLLQLAAWYVGNEAQAQSLREWQARMGIVVVISLIIAASYTFWPKRPPTDGPTAASAEAPADAQTAAAAADSGGAGQRFSPGTQSTSPDSLFAVRARMNRRSESRFR
ncbi:hypothetical protein [Streptomyces durbertensis]|uniref:hypothetical protein n=1 Tax=Streptomyces durbertensis TaxID=2448886 RepID=UPI003F69BEC7